MHCADEGGDCECDGTVYYIKQATEARLTLDSILIGEYGEANGSVSCENDTFFKDVAPG